MDINYFICIAPSNLELKALVTHLSLLHKTIQFMQLDQLEMEAKEFLDRLNWMEVTTKDN